MILVLLEKATGGVVGQIDIELPMDAYPFFRYSTPQGVITIELYQTYRKGWDTCIGIIDYLDIGYLVLNESFSYIGPQNVCGVCMYKHIIPHSQNTIEFPGPLIGAAAQSILNVSVPIIDEEELDDETE